MLSSPHSVKRRRPSSGYRIPSSPVSIQSSGDSPIRPSHSRKSSTYSVHSPVTPRPISSHDRNTGFSFSNDFEGAIGVEQGLGSLADELAEAWDEDGGSEEEASEIQVDGESQVYNDDFISRDQFPRNDHDATNTNGNSLKSSILQPQQNGSLDLKSIKPTLRSKHRRKPTEYSGSDYGSDSDYEDGNGVLRSLDTRISTIERLAHQAPTYADTDKDVCKRVADNLKDLGSQAGVENGARR